jgi:antitoxin (DNA-binding transcriptional repressor) of toxin-antitoxin stability system
MHEAETNFSHLVARVLAGEEIVIAEDGKPLVQITLTEDKKPRIPGFAAGEFTVPDSFFEPMSEEDFDLWYK